MDESSNWPQGFGTQSTGGASGAPRVLGVWLCAAVMVFGCGSAVGAEALRIVPNRAVEQAKQPQLAVTDAGDVYVAYGQDETIYVSASHDQGKTFSPGVSVADVPSLALGLRRGPRIVAQGENVIVAAISHRSGTLMAWRSSDGGVTWRGPATVNDKAESAAEGMHAMTISPSGTIACAWLDHRSGRKELYTATSADAGATWSANRLAYHSPDGSICECCHPSAAFGADGALRLLWRNHIGPLRDVFWCTSSDAGATFTTGLKLGQESWVQDGCPMDGGAVAAAPNGVTSAVWRRDKQVYLTSGEAGHEELLGPGEQPWLAATSAGPYAVWLEKRPGTLWLRSPGDPHPRRLAREANFPVVAASLSGAGPIVAAWEEPGSVIVIQTLGDE